MMYFIADQQYIEAKAEYNKQHEIMYKRYLHYFDKIDTLEKKEAFINKMPSSVGKSLLIDRIFQQRNNNG